MLIIPVGTDRAAERSLPFTTLAVAGVLLVVYFATASRLDASALAETDAAERAADQYAASPYTVIPDAVLAQLPKAFQDTYTQNQAWTRDYLAREADMAPPAVGTDRLGLPSAGGAGPAGAVTALTSGGSEHAILVALLRTTTPEVRSAAQSALDTLMAAYQATRADNLARRLGYSPASPSALGLFAHWLLHGGLAPLIFNLLFFLPAAASLEVKWQAPLILATIVICSAVGSLCYGLASPGSDAPLLGASGAVAGLLGAFLMRLWHVRIDFLYVVLSGLRLKPGTFSAPAGVMIPIWGVATVVYGLIFSDRDGATHWAEAGGFLTGAVLAVVYRALRLERARPGGMTSVSDVVAASDMPGGLFAQELARHKDWDMAQVPSSRRASASAAAPAPPVTIAGHPPLGAAPVRAPDPAPVIVLRAPDAAPGILLRAPDAAPGILLRAPDAAPVIVLPSPAPSLVAAPPPNDALPLDPVPLDDPIPTRSEPETTSEVGDAEALPSPLLPDFTIAFKPPDRGAPEATLAAVGSLGLGLREAIRSDDDRTILAAFVRSRSRDEGKTAKATVEGLDAAEALRLARALGDEGFPTAAVDVARTAAQSEPSGPFAARLLVFAARLLYEHDLDRSAALAMVEQVVARFPGDPIRGQAAGFAARWRS